MASHIPFDERPLCSRDEAKQALGSIGDTLFYRLVNDGRLEIRKLGDKTVVTTELVLRTAREGAPPARPRRPPSPRGRRREAPAAG